MYSNLVRTSWAILGHMFPLAIWWRKPKYHTICDIIQFLKLSRGGSRGGGLGAPLQKSAPSPGSNSYFNFWLVGLRHWNNASLAYNWRKTKHKKKWRKSFSFFSWARLGCFKKATLFRVKVLNWPTALLCPLNIHPKLQQNPTIFRPPPYQKVCSRAQNFGPVKTFCGWGGV